VTDTCRLELFTENPVIVTPIYRLERNIEFIEAKFCAVAQASGRNRISPVSRFSFVELRLMIIM
jgi:hypothetical protein